jgi:hypothetical protein
MMQIDLSLSQKFARESADGLAIIKATDIGLRWTMFGFIFLN